MSIEITFDKIAAVYDAQRAHPPEVADEVGRAIVAAAGANARILELGVGTGRMALPCAAVGAQVVGLDVSAGMLAVAADRAATAGLRLDLLQGDAETLPFGQGNFDAALAVHVLHLLKDWRAGLGEIVRVVRPGGCLVQGSDWRDPDSCVGLLRGRLRMAIMELQPGSRPPGAGAAVVQALARLGGSSAEPIVAARWTRPLSPAQILDGMAARFDAETWALPDDLLAAALERVRAWAGVQWSDLTQMQDVEQRFLITVTRFGGDAD